MTRIASQWIIAEAERLGFEACGITQATVLKEESMHVEQWLESGYEGEMGYLTRNKEKRYDPRLLVEGTKSIVTVLYNYFPKQTLSDSDRFKIAKYAYGADYHDVLKRKMRQLLERIEKQTGKLEGTRVFVDSAPVLDRAWAVRSGLGFIGKNTTLIHPKKGSFFFIGHLFLPIELEETDRPMTNRCGRCTKCLDACPTRALESPFHIDARKCISYLTIEYKGSLAGIDPKTFKGWMYGCDICQDVCPYNRFALPNHEPEFQPSQKLLDMHEDDWIRLSKDEFKALFKHSAVQRAGYEGLKKNIEFISSGELRDTVHDNE
ncbi:MAG: tRNA epoxyqueuosine(34) reductase QueG [Bacteroidales bacterium]|nr:tRNA epoxyqueuosine(34) reductase QueG [Bacteroidales bacterium]